MGAGEGHEAIHLQEVKDACAKKIGDDADVVSKIERIPKVYAAIAVRAVV